MGAAPPPGLAPSKTRAGREEPIQPNPPPSCAALYERAAAGQARTLSQDDDVRSAPTRARSASRSRLEGAVGLKCGTGDFTERDGKGDVSVEIGGNNFSGAGTLMSTARF